jgi:predicted DNA-binding protein
MAKRSEASAIVSTQVSVETAERLRDLARANDRTVSAEVRRAILEHLNDQPPHAADDEAA